MAGNAEAQSSEADVLALHLSHAGEHLRGDRLEEAAAEIESALQLSPTDLRARNLLGLLHFRAGRFEDALQVYRQLQKERENDTALRLNLGLVELRMGHYREAVEHLSWVVQAEPDNTRAQGYYGLALMRAGELPKARQVLLQAGQEELVHQVDNLLSIQKTPAAPPAGAPAPPSGDAAQGEAAPAAMAPVDTAPHGPFREARPSFPPPRPAREPIPPASPEDSSLDQEGRYSISEARRAAAAGARDLEEEQPFSPARPAEQGRGESDWQLRPPSQGLPAPLPSSRSPLRPLPIPVPQERSLPPPPVPANVHQVQPLLSFVRQHELAPPSDGSSFGITPDGMLVVRIAGQLPTRSIGVVVSTGELTFDPLQRRSRGRTLSDTFGEGAAGVFRASGNGMMVISPRGGHFSAVSLHDESLYVKEVTTFAFEEGLHWENGRLPGAGPAPTYGYPGLPDVLGRVVQFRGSGQLVLRTERPPFTVRLTGGQTAFIEVEQLIGWVGRIIPSLLTEDSGAPTPYVECTGDGFLLVEPPPKEGNPAAPLQAAGPQVTGVAAPDIPAA